MLRIVEISWLIVVLFGSMLGIYKTFSESFISAAYIFIFTIIGAIFYMMRRKLRIAREKKENEGINKD